MKYSLSLIYIFFHLLTLAQTSQEKVFVDKIIIKGNKKTKDQIITRELSFKEGLLYKRSELDSMFVWDRNRIYNYNLFNTVEITMNEKAPQLVDVIITVDERWYFYPIPIFKLVDRNFNDWWFNRGRDLSRVNIGLRLTQYNFRGRAERLRLVFQTGFTNQVGLGYRIPYIEKTQRHGLEIQFGFNEAKNLAYNTFDNVNDFLSSDSLLQTTYKTTLIHSYRSSFYSFHRTRISHSSGHISDTISRLNPNYYGDGRTTQQYVSLGYSYVWDKRNNRNYTTKGEYYSGSIDKFGLGIYEDPVDFWLFQFTLAKYIPLSERLFYQGYLNGVFSTTDNRSYNNYFAIGFQQQILRGYDLYIVEGGNFGIFRNDLKYKIFSFSKNIKEVMPVKQFQTFPVSLFSKIFFDQGYAKGYPNYSGSDLLSDEYLYSYGVGLDFMLIYDAILRLELSRNSLNETNFFINFGTLF